MKTQRGEELINERGMQDGCTGSHQTSNGYTKDVFWTLSYTSFEHGRCEASSKPGIPFRFDEEVQSFAS